MALDASQFTLAGVNPVTNQLPLHDIGPIVDPGSFRNEPLRQNQIAVGQQERTMNEMKLQDAARQQKLQRNLDKKLPRDATPLDHDILSSYNTEIGGTPPVAVDSDGRQVYDMNAIRNLMANKRALQFEAEGGFNKTTPFQDAALAELAKSGYLASAYDPKTGMLKDENGLYNALLQTPRISSKDSVALQDSINELQSMQDLIASVRTRATSENVGARAGSWAATKWARAAALFGFDDKQFEDHRALEMFIDQRALKAAEAMKGALSDNDIKFLKNSQIKMVDSPEAWDEYLKRFEDLNAKALANRRAGIFYDEGESTPVDRDGNPVRSGATGAPGSSVPVTPDGGAVDFSTYDQKPAVIRGLPNSQALRGQAIRRADGTPALRLNGKDYRLSDSEFNSLWQLQQDAKGRAQPATPAPAQAPSGNLRNLSPSTGILG